MKKLSGKRIVEVLNDVRRTATSDAFAENNIGLIALALSFDNCAQAIRELTKFIKEEVAKK